MQNQGKSWLFIGLLNPIPDTPSSPSFAHRFPELVVELLKVPGPTSRGLEDTWHGSPGDCEGPVSRFPSREGIRQLETSHRFLSSKRVHPTNSFLDGDSPFNSEIYQRGRLHVLDRPEGCILLGTHLSGILEVLTLYLTEYNLPVHGSLFWSLFMIISSWAHNQGVRLLCYLDDWLILASFREQLLNNLDKLLSLCQEMGTVVNWKNFATIPKTPLTWWQVQQILSAILQGLCKWRPRWDANVLGKSYPALFEEDSDISTKLQISLHFHWPE